jgi:GTP cyclohydrolase I
MNKLNKANGNLPRTEEEKNNMIIEASKHYGNFLESLGFDYKNDPQTVDTPLRVSKSWINDLIMGSITLPPKMATFPNEEKYNGVVIQTGINVVSMCAHHNLPFTGYASIAYVPEENVIGLSKLNRVVDWFARRPQMQESLTQQIHNFLTENLKCKSIAVSISSKHMCCGLRGIKHPNSVMTTNKFSGVFMEPGNLIREEFLQAINKNGHETNN